MQQKQESYILPLHYFLQQLYSWKTSKKPNCPQNTDSMHMYSFYHPYNFPNLNLKKQLGQKH